MSEIFVVQNIEMSEFLYCKEISQENILLFKNVFFADETIWKEKEYIGQATM